jgi:hypothetical protein
VPVSRTTHSAFTPSARVRALVLGLAIGVAALPMAAAAGDTVPVVTPSYSPDAWLSLADPFELRLDRALTPEEGRLAVLIDRTDWTGLFRAAPGGLTYSPGAVPLPRGEREMTIYLVSPANEWRELAKVPLRVLLAGGFERAEARPTLEIGNRGQLAVGRFPGRPPEPRDTFQDVTVNVGLQTRLTRNGWTTSTQSSFVGVSNQTEALRFGFKGADAPQFDLAQYRIDGDQRHVKFALGHSTLQGGRHLLSGFSSRGAEVTLRPAPAVNVAIAAANGSSIVGFSNFFGLDQRAHQVVSATVGIDLVPARPEGVRVTAGVLDASVLPLSGFNQGNINDREQSRGLSFNGRASDPGQRLQVEAGTAWSRFVNPEDALLAQGLALVPVQQTTRAARYADVRVALVQDVALSATQRAGLSVAVRHELVEPLYRSIGAAGVRSDLLQNGLDLDGRLGPLVSRLGYGWSRDNLPRLASILTTQTRQANWTNSLSPGALIRRESAWIPTFDYSLNRTHQFGEGLPANADFDSFSQVPDQVSLNQSAGVQWQGATWRAGYTYNRSLQDNRQVGREPADFLNLTHSGAFALAVSTRLDLNLNVAWDGADNRELAEREQTRRVGLGASWRPAARATLTGMTAATFTRDARRTRNGRNADLSLEYAQGIALARRMPDRLQAQLFARFSRQTFDAFNGLFGIDDRQRTWTLNSGVTLRVF